MSAPASLRELVKTAPHVSFVCGACGHTHRPGRQSRRALECMLQEARNLSVAIDGFAKLVDRGQKPSLEVVLQVMFDCQHLCQAVTEHAVAEL